MTFEPSMTFEALRGVDPEVLAEEILEIVAHDIEHQPRSLQKEIGPSEIGSPCARKVAYGLLQVPKLNMHVLPKWKAYVGTGVHKVLERALDRYNLEHAARYHYQERFYVEEELQVGEIAGVPLIGHCDVYDRLTATVIDWKTTGPTALKDYRANGPGPQYRTQAHLYGRGWAKYRGLPVDRVMLVFFPRQGELKDSYIWHEPYDEQVALDALARCDAITDALGALGPDLTLAQLPTAEDHCGFCDWLVPGRTSNFINGCPGQQTEIRIPAPAMTLEGKP